MIASWYDFIFAPVGNEFLWVLVVKILALILILMTTAAYLTLAERKVAGHIQLRYGPNRVGPFGFMQPAADAVKLIFKENAGPAGRDRFLYVVGPSLAGVAALFAFAVIPLSAPNGLSATLNHQAYNFHWNIAHLNVGLLFIFAMTSLGVYSIFLGGWSANSKYSLLGGLRSSAQLISYEMAVSFAVIGVVILAGSLDLEKIVDKQAHGWFILMQPLAFFLYFIGALAETNRLPFDLPEAETELVGGYHTEYPSMRFGFYFLGEYINVFTVSCIATVLFLGGWQPLLPFLGFIPGVLWFGAKAFTLVFVILWIRWSWPRFRYDRLMNFGWKVLLPLGLLNIVITGAIVGLKAA
jgi:NADH-quinone oxidoreductase subunit H